MSAKILNDSNSKLRHKKRLFCSNFLKPVSFIPQNIKTLSASAGSKTLPYKLQSWSECAQRSFPKLEWNRFYDPSHIYKGTVRFALIFSSRQFFKFLSLIVYHKYLKPIIYIIIIHLELELHSPRGTVRFALIFFGSHLFLDRIN